MPNFTDEEKAELRRLIDSITRLANAAIVPVPPWVQASKRLLDEIDELKNAARTN